MSLNLRRGLRLRAALAALVLCLSVTLVLVLAVPAFTAPAPAPESLPGGEPITLLAGKGVAPFRVPPLVPPGGVRVQTATINVNYIPAGGTSQFGQTLQGLAGGRADCLQLCRRHLGRLPEFHGGDHHQRLLDDPGYRNPGPERCEDVLP